MLDLFCFSKNISIVGFPWCFEKEAWPESFFDRNSHSFALSGAGRSLQLPLEGSNLGANSCWPTYSGLKSHDFCNKDPSTHCKPGWWIFSLSLSKKPKSGVVCKRDTTTIFRMIHQQVRPLRWPQGLRIIPSLEFFGLTQRFFQGFFDGNLCTL